MSDSSQHPVESGPPHRLVEIGAAIFTGALGLIAIVGSLRVGINWGVEGPKAGFFPFYVGLFILVGSVINLYNAVTSDARGRLFATWGQLRKVTSVVVPTGIYVLLVPMLGIYVPSMLLIGVFMKWLGGYRWPFTIAMALGVPIIFFIVFERWFMIPLPKGRVEDLLGL